MKSIMPLMRILAVDTSSAVGSIALLEGPRVVAELTLQASEPHNRRLLKNIDRCLQEANWRFEQLDGFAVGIGPGSFTGLRIGVTTLKTLAWATSKPFAAISSLDALAAALAFSALPVCPLIDARKQEVYFALYRPNGQGGLTRHSPWAVDTPARIAAKIQEPTVFCGDGWPLCQETFSKQLGDRAIEAPSPFQVLRASFIGDLAWKRLHHQPADDPAACVPLYVRPSEAELHYPHLSPARL